MKSSALIPVEEYLRTAYSPDCDYIDGEVQERNLGERDHSVTQRELIRFFFSVAAEKKVFVYPEQRVQVAATRYRVPDLCVVVGEEARDQVFRTPPFLCIEVISPEDRWPRMQERIDDYLAFGVPHVWVIDPVEQRAWVYTAAGGGEAKGGLLTTRHPSLELSLAALFGDIRGGR